VSHLIDTENSYETFIYLFIYLFFLVLLSSLLEPLIYFIVICSITQHEFQDPFYTTCFA